ncbi:MAG: hypothetical protein HZA91_12020 [Verrucomicrobia bacterium]|nr:hypothetical protein [Verrucomicrobiota bacterium]
MIPLLAAIITLETDTTRIGFDPARNGAIVSLVDKASGKEFAASPAVPLLYELRFTNAPPDATLVTDADAVDVTVKREGGEVVIAAPRHKNAAVSVECRFRTERGSPLIHGRIAVRGGEKFTLAAARFPALAWKKQLGPSPEREFLVLPRNDGCIVQAPGKAGWLPTAPYPGSASMQFIACYDDTAGLYAACWDKQAFAKQIGVEKGRDSLRLAFLHYPTREPRREWRLEYDVVLGTFRGDWQTAADIYKSWAVNQPWCRRTLAQRVADGDVPKWLAEPSLFYAYSLRGMDEQQQWINRLPLVSQQADAWRALLGGPTTFMMMAWEKKGPWVTPDYFPPFGGEKDFKATTEALHAKGNHTLVFLSGLKWTLRKSPAYQHGAAPFDDTAEFERRGTASAICGTDGRPQKWGTPDKDVGEHAQICAATPLGRKILLDAALECQRLGIDCVQADQIVGGGLPACYNTRHGHPPGGGNWCAAALYKIFADIRREGKKRDKSFAWSIEEPTEFFIPVLDTYHARDYAQGRWPRDGGVIGVPLFTHVYHEFMHGYGGDSCYVSTNASPTGLYQQAMNLVCGKAPGVAVWTRPYDPAATHALQARMLRSHFELWSGPAREFLVFGRRVASPALNVPTTRAKFSPKSSGPPSELDMPAVLHSSWRLPDGRAGTVFACIANEPVTFDAIGKTLTLQPGEAKFVEHGAQ